MSVISHINVQKARLEPESVFSRPLDVVSEPGLTRGQKIATLQRWSQSLQDLLRASGEGMIPSASKQPGTDAATLEEIAEALVILQEEQPSAK